MSKNELVQACIKNDKTARHQLIEQHYGYLMGMCRRYAKNNQQAEAFFNQAFIEVFKHLPEYHDNTSLDEWIKKIFITNLIFQLKSNRTEYYITTTTRMEDKKAHTDLFHQTEDHDPNKLPVEDYLYALQKMPSSFRAIYNLHIIDGFSLSQTSELMEISEESAKNSIERARNEFLKNVNLKLQGY